MKTVSVKNFPFDLGFQYGHMFSAKYTERRYYRNAIRTTRKHISFAQFKKLKESVLDKIHPNRRK